MRLAVVRQFGFLQVIADFFFLDTVEHRRGKTQAEQPCRPAEVRFQYLADVHARGHAQRVQNNVHRRSFGQEGHVLLGHNLGHDTLVSVAARHLVAD